MSIARSVRERRALRTHRPSVLALEGRTLMAASPRVDLFAVPTLTSNPSQIVVGPDAALWLSESNRHDRPDHDDGPVRRLRPADTCRRRSADARWPDRRARRRRLGH